MQNFVVARTSLLGAFAAAELAATPPPGTTAAGGVRARSVSHLRLFQLSSVSTALALRMLRARRAAVAASTSSEASAHMASAKSSMIAVPKYPCVFRSPAVAAAASFSQMVVAPARRAATSSLNSEATCTQPTIPCKLLVASPTTPASSTQSGAPSRTTRSPALSSDSSTSSGKSAMSAEVIETTDREVEEAAGPRKAVTSANASRPHSTERSRARRPCTMLGCVL